jgi:hypothetical protein
MDFKTYQPDQMSLVTAITSELSKQNPELRMDSALFNKVIEAANLVCDECARERVYAVTPMTPDEWLKSDDVGESSKYMLTVLANLGLPAPNGPTPRDAEDLGRCIRMMKACGLSDQIDKMKEMGEKWARIANWWGQLNEWYADEKWETIYGYFTRLED